MKTNTEKDENKCRICKRIIIDESKFGICPDCLNKYGTTAATIVVTGLLLVGSKVLKSLISREV